MPSTTSDARVRDDQLTPKQLQALPILAEAHVTPGMVPANGIDICIEQHIISSREYYYHKWDKKPLFMKRLAQECEMLRGHATEYCKNKVAAHMNQILDALFMVAFCRDDSKYANQKTTALRSLLAIGGVDTSSGSKVDISIVANIREKQTMFRERIEESQRQRHEQISTGTARIPNGRKGPSRN